MAYHPQQIIKEITDRINIGDSLNKISREMSIAKSTLYYHYKKIKGKKFKDVEFNFSSEELGEFLGIFAGDGTFNSTKNGEYNIRIFIGYYEKEYAYDLEKFFFIIFKKKPSIWQRKESLITLTYRSKKLYQFIKNYLTWTGKKTYSIKLKNLNYPREFLIGFLKGLLDTDGHYQKNRYTVSFSTVSKNLHLQTSYIIKNILNIKFGTYIRHKKGRSPIYNTLIYGEDGRTILRILNPRNPSKRLANDL